MSAVIKSARLEWLCQVCRKRIENGEGWADIPTQGYREARPGYAGPPVGWQFRHTACVPEDDVPEDDRATYDIEIERLRRWSHLVDWTAHLVLGKLWGPYTNWNEMIDQQLCFAEHHSRLQPPEGTGEFEFYRWAQKWNWIVEETAWVTLARSPGEDHRFGVVAQAWESDAQRLLNRLGGRA